MAAERRSLSSFSGISVALIVGSHGPRLEMRGEQIRKSQRAPNLLSLERSSEQRGAERGGGG